MILVWVLLGVAFLAAEAAISTALFALFLAVGFFAGGVADALGAPLAADLAVIAIVDLVGIAVARPPLVRRAGRGTSLPVSGVSGLAGQMAHTADEVGDEHHPGHAVLAGERWLAVSATGDPVPPHTTVVVAEVRGTTLVVAPAAGASPPVERRSA